MDAKSTIRDLLLSQHLAVLATQERGQPYTSLVTFASSEELRRVWFPTLRSTRKFANLTAEPRVALLVDSRSHQASDLTDAYALTALGAASDTTGDERGALVDLYLGKNPQLRDFVSSPDCALIQVRIQRYLLVGHFQEVVELKP